MEVVKEGNDKLEIPMDSIRKRIDFNVQIRAVLRNANSFKKAKRLFSEEIDWEKVHEIPEMTIKEETEKSLPTLSGEFKTSKKGITQTGKRKKTVFLRKGVPIIVMY